MTQTHHMQLYLHESPGSIVCLGFGYVAQRLARQVRSLAPDRRMIGTTRQRGDACENVTLLTLREDAGHTAVMEALTGSSLVLVSIPPGQEHWLVELVRRHRPACAPLLYLSATSVYGDHGGAWVNERSALQPTLARSKERLKAETVWRDAGAIALRLGGIYGPGRSVFDRLDTAPVEKPGHVFNRVHVDDIVSAIFAAARHNPAGDAFNIVDDCPTDLVPLYREAAQLAGRTPLPATPFDEAKMSAARAGFYAEHKRVANARAKAVLGWQLQYRDYRAGLAAIFAEMNAG